MKKADLIYQAATEAVLKARIEISKILDKQDFDKVDEHLHKAMNDAGSFAVKAHKADARKYKNGRQLVEQ